MQQELKLQPCKKCKVLPELLIGAITSFIGCEKCNFIVLVNEDIQKPLESVIKLWNEKYGKQTKA